MRVPAKCDICGAIFDSGIELEGCTNVSITNTTSGPCPRCGGTGGIPNGVYNIIGNTIEILKAPGRSVSDLQRLADLLKRAREEGSSVEEVKQKIVQEVPEISSLKDVLPKSRSDLYAFIGVILIALGLIMKCPDRKIEVSEVVNNYYIEQKQVTEPPPPSVVIPKEEETKPKAELPKPRLVIPKTK